MALTASYEKPEVVIGLVAQTGTDLDRVTQVLGSALAAFGYSATSVRLSHLLDMLEPKDLGVELVTDRGREFERIKSHMDAGNALRRRTQACDILAMYAVAEIARKRPSADAGVPGRDTPARYQAGRAYVLHSLKTPDEVTTLRQVYGPGFFLLGVHSQPSERKKYFRERRNLTDPQIAELFARDENEGGDAFGQRTRDTFHLADAFISLDDSPDSSLTRLVRLLFGDPYKPPTQAEHAMFLAFATALRSADLSRQVGAALFDADGDLVATGANDVPRAKGGQYWPNGADQRDYVRGRDSNKRQINELVSDTLDRLFEKGDLDRPKLEAKLKGGLIHDITEYGRAVHAEMEALLAAARAGRSTRGSTLFVTTFPCHNCAKHIIGAGVSRVVYVEPYPKSRALELHDDAITLGPPRDGMITFEPFIGVGPRRYIDLFSMTLGSGRRMERKRDGTKLDWPHEGDATLRVHAVPLDYLENERLTAKAVQEAITNLRGA